MKRVVLIITAVSALAFASGHGKHEGDMNNYKHHKKMTKKADSPFLINNKMPHLTKLVKKNWDKLNLTATQKSKLLKVRKETMAAVMSLKPKIMKLENKIVRYTMRGDKPSKLKYKVNELAKLKAKLTMSHIKCIYKTKKILTKEQLKMLLKK